MSLKTDADSAYHSRNRHRAARKVAERELTMSREATRNMTNQYLAAEREVERLRSVVNAAIEWRDSDSDDTYWALVHAVDDYLTASREDQPNKEVNNGSEDD